MKGLIREKSIVESGSGAVTYSLVQVSPVHLGQGRG